MDPIRAYVGHERDSDIEAWDGIVTWRTLLSADRTPTRCMTAGVAIIEPDASEEGAEHHHADDEIYYFVAGVGWVVPAMWLVRWMQRKDPSPQATDSSSIR